MPRYVRPYKGRTAKKVLNTTATKKKDNMLTSYGVGFAGAPGIGPYIMSPTPTFFSPNPTPFAPNVFLWMPSARGLSGAADQTTVGRTDTNPYMVGLRENWTMRTNSGIEWQWRRIVFTMKGGPLRSPNLWYVDGGAGYTRLLRNLSEDTSSSGPGSALYLALVDLVFDGTLNVDYSNVFTAKTDNTRVTIKSDRTRNLNSGNQNGRIITLRTYTPMNKTLNYDDEENGPSIVGSSYSTLGKPGMGDVYVLDLFRGNGTTSDQLVVSSDATLYWHEK